MGVDDLEVYEKLNMLPEIFQPRPYSHGNLSKQKS